MRPYRDEEDYWRIRAFLREVFLLNGRREMCWQAARLDYWRWHVVLNCEALPAIEPISSCGIRPAGSCRRSQPEGLGEVFLQVSSGPDYSGVIEDMLDVAESHSRRADARGGARSAGAR